MFWEFTTRRLTLITFSKFNIRLVRRILDAELLIRSCLFETQWSRTCQKWLIFSSPEKNTLTQVSYHSKTTFATKWGRQNHYLEIGTESFYILSCLFFRVPETRASGADILVSDKYAFITSNFTRIIKEMNGQLSKQIAEHFTKQLPRPCFSKAVSYTQE